MNKLIKRLAVLFFMFITFMFLFAACGGDKNITENNADSETQASVTREKAYDTCFLLGKTKNVRLPDIDILKEELLKLVGTEKYYSVVVLDGNPDSSDFKGKISFSNRLFNQKKNDQEVLNAHLKRIAEIMPKEKEIDILKGLDSARKALFSCENKRLVIFSSGISTSGELNFAKDPQIIEELPSETVKRLEKSKSLPDLSDIEIIWYGFGDVSGKQKELNSINYFRLKKIWIEILRKCGVSDPESVFVDSLPVLHSEDIYDTELEYPDVSEVKFPGIMSIEEDEIGFEKDKATFKNKKAAIKALNYYAECIDNSSGVFYLVGSTATIEDFQYCQELSYKRAKAVKDLLCGTYEIPADRLKIFPMGNINLGGEYEWREYDLNSDGTLNEEVAPKNRRVFIIEAGSEEGKLFIKQWKQWKNQE